MVWRIPRNNAHDQDTAPARNRGYRKFSESVMREILQDKMKSTYQNDFMGIPQGLSKCNIFYYRQEKDSEGS